LFENLALQALIHNLHLKQKVFL